MNSAVSVVKSLAASPIALELFVYLDKLDLRISRHVCYANSQTVDYMSFVGHHREHKSRVDVMVVR